MKSNVRRKGTLQIIMIFFSGCCCCCRCCSVIFFKLQSLINWAYLEKMIISRQYRIDTWSNISNVKRSFGHLTWACAILSFFAQQIINTTKNYSINQEIALNFCTWKRSETNRYQRQASSQNVEENWKCQTIDRKCLEINVIPVLSGKRHHFNSFSNLTHEKYSIVYERRK